MITNNSPHLGVLFRSSAPQAFISTSFVTSVVPSMSTLLPAASISDVDWDAATTRVEHGSSLPRDYYSAGQRRWHGAYGRENNATTLVPEHLSGPRTATSNINGKQCRAGLVDVPDAVPRNAIRHVVVLDRLVWLR